jgi:chromosome segregation ATPase
VGTKEVIASVIKELILPEIETLRRDNEELKARLDLTNKRLDDINLHLADQSRRIDSIRDELNKRINSVRDELIGMIAEINRRLDRLYEVIVRREEHEELKVRLTRLEDEVQQLKARLVA